MTAFAGRLFKLKIEYPAASNTYIDFGGMTNCSVSFANEEVDITDKYSNGVKELLESGGVRSVTVSGELYTKDTVPDELINTLATENDMHKMRVSSDAGEIFTSLAQVTSLERSGSFNDMEQYSISIVFSGEIVAVGLDNLIAENNDNLIAENSDNLIAG